MLFSVLVGIPLGFLAAKRYGGFFDHFSLFASLLGISIPIFVLAIILKYIFAVRLGWLPTVGRISVLIDLEHPTNFYVLDAILTRNWEALWDAIQHLILPAIALGTIPLAIITRITRASVLDVQNEDYVRTARAKGVAPRTVDGRHILRNAMLPIATIIGLQTGLLLSGAVLTETVFAWPGVGSWLVGAIEFRDYAVLQGGILFIAIVFVIVNLLVDLSYGLLNPKDPALMSVAEIEAREAQFDSAAGGLWRDAWARLRRNPGALAGFAIVGLFFVVALFAPLLAPEDPRVGDLSRLGGSCCPGPSLDHWFGIDQQGRDELTRILYGARYSLLIGVVSVAVGLSVGMIFGSIAGYVGGAVDSVIMRLTDIMLAIPGLLLAIGIVAMLGPGIFQIMVAVGVTQIPIFTRLMRGSILAQRENDFVLAARSIGVPRRAILASHILPNAISPVIVQATLALATAIIDVAGARLARPRPAGSLDARVGDDADRHDALPADGAAPRDHPRRRDHHHRARLQPDRRRPARGTRPEDAG